MRRVRLLILTASALAAAMSAGCNPLGGHGRGSNESFLAFGAPPTPAEAARWAVDPNSPDNRQQGILLLANAIFGGESVYMELYRIALDDEDAAVRAAAVRAFALHGGPPEGRLIMDRLGPDEDPLVRREVARALSRIHVPESVPLLTRAVDPVSEPDGETRALAAEALAQHREPRVVQALIGALTDTRLLVSSTARRSLNTLTGEDFGIEPEPWLRWTAASPNMFEGAQTFYYTAYQRDRRILEYVVPWLEPPNEIASTPAGMPVEGG